MQASLDQPGVPDPAALTSSAGGHLTGISTCLLEPIPLAIVAVSRRVEAELRRWLTEKGVEVPQEGLNALAQLVALRNLAVHAPERVSVQEALEFVALTEATLFAIRAGGKKRDRRIDTGG